MPVSAHKISTRMIETVEPTLSVILVIFLPDFLDDVFVVEHGQVAALLRHASVDCSKGTGGEHPIHFFLVFWSFFWRRVI